MPRLLLTALAVAALWLGGQAWSSTSSSLSEHITAPGGTSPLVPQERIDLALSRLPNRSGYAQGADGVPIFWRAIDPRDYRTRYTYQPSHTESSGGHGDFALYFSVPPQTGGIAQKPPRGTVVLLHGWMMDGDAMLPWALQFANAGYRSISLDLRNHGRSGKGLSGYGLREADDVGDVIRELRAQGEVQGPVYLFGVSYGAATALFTAREMGNDIAGVVAMESFANAGRGIRDMLPHMLSLQAHDLKDEATLGVARLLYRQQGMDEVMAQADRQLGLDLDRVDVAAALAKTRACVLLVHGGADEHIPVEHGRELADASPRARYLEVAGENHISLPMRIDELGGTVDGWFAALPRAKTSCPNPQAPLLAAR